MEGHEHLGGELHLLLLRLLLAQQRLQTRGFALVTLHSFNWFAFEMRVRQTPSKLQLSLSQLYLRSCFNIFSIREFDSLSCVHPWFAPPDARLLLACLDWFHFNCFGFTRWSQSVVLVLLG